MAAANGNNSITRKFAVNFIILGLLLLITSLTLFSRGDYLGGGINAVGALYCILMGSFHL